MRISYFGKTPLALIALFFSLAGCIFSGDQSSKSLEGSRPNIILVLTDDQGMGDLSCMGNTILQTPNIDRLYGQATRFTDFQVSPTCSPTRAAIMSGRYPFEVGVSHTIMQRDRLAPAVVTFPQALQKAGYKTGLFGKWHLGDGSEYLPQKRGFDEVLMHGAGGIGQYGFGDFKENSNNKYFDNVLLHNETIVRTKGFCTDLFFKAALGWMKTQYDTDAPFFTYLSLNAPHGPLIAPDKYKKRFLDDGYDKSTAARYGMIENIDNNMGILMQKLNDWNVLENTLVIFMTDNGMAMKNIGNRARGRLTAWNAGMKGSKDTNWEGGTHVPSFWYWKGILDQGVDISALTAHIDLYRTFCELAGADIPESTLPPKGRSLLPLLEDPKSKWTERTIYSHRGRWGGGGRGKATRSEAKYYGASVRDQRWRLVFEMDNEEPWLSDISKDLGETKNLIKTHPEVVEKLKQQFDTWWASTEPYLVNKDLPRISAGKHHLQILYDKQLKEKGIPDWEPETITASKSPSTVIPSPSRLKKFMPSRHEAKLLEAKNRPIDLVMIGDSITHNWEYDKNYTKTFTNSSLLNLGFAGDRTQNVLWRIHHGALDGISPQLVTLMIGTNHFHNAKLKSHYTPDSAEDVYTGIRTIVKEIGTRLPEAKIIVFSVFPRKSPEQERVKSLNAILPKIADNKAVFHADINRVFLDQNGELKKELYKRDQLHLSPLGYAAWASALKAILHPLKPGRTDAPE